MRRVWGFVLQDTTDFKYDDADDMIEWAEFKLILDNGFPVDGKIQMYFTDATYTILDSLLNPFQQILLSAISGSPPDCRVTANTKKQTLIRWDKQRWQHLKTCKKILIRANLNTSNNGTTIIKMYSDYGLDIRLGIKAQGHTMINFH